MPAFWQVRDEGPPAKMPRLSNLQPVDPSSQSWHSNPPAAAEGDRKWGDSWATSENAKWAGNNWTADNSNGKDSSQWSRPSWTPQQEKPPSKLQTIDWASKSRQPFRREFVPYGAVNLQEARSLRSALGIEIEHDPAGETTTPAPISSFSEIAAIPDWVMTALQDNKWDTPMQIQAQALPIALAGKDIIGIAQTGSGKTGAFLLPAFVHIDHQEALSSREPGPVCLILAPTRELAVQISDEAAKLAKHSWNSKNHSKGFRTAVFYGGGRKSDQLRTNTWEGAHIVVATPGRLLDFLGEGKVSLLRVTYLVLDEADRMLDMGFAGDVETISSQVRPERQTMFFSATWSSAVQAVAQDFCGQDPVRIRCKHIPKDGVKVTEVAVGNGEMLSAREGITQEVVVVDLDWKSAEPQKRLLLDAHVRKALNQSEDSKVLVFVQSKTYADELVEKLVNDGWKADSIHGGRYQEDRLRVLDEFRQGQLRLLVATDVLGRGIDIPNVTHVVIFEMGSIADYVHRIGRTGRGKDATGHALVFFEYFHKFPNLAADLSKLLHHCKQPVPPELTIIAQEVLDGKREIFDHSAPVWNKKLRAYV